MKRWAWVLSLGSLVAMVILAWGIAVQPTPLISPPFSYSAETFEARPNMVCAGEAFEYGPLTVTVTRQAVWTNTRSVWSLDTNRTVMTSEQLTEYAAAADQPQRYDRSGVWVGGEEINVTGSFTVPTTLEPGRYEFRSATSGSDSSADVYTVPFTIKECQ